jgi:hypothetical protein
MLLNFFMIFHFFYSTYNLVANRKIMWKTYVETNYKFIMSHFYLNVQWVEPCCNFVTNQRLWKFTIFNPKVGLALPLQFLILKFDLHYPCTCKWIIGFITKLVTHVSSWKGFWAQHNLKNKRLGIKIALTHDWKRLT